MSCRQGWTERANRQQKISLAWNKVDFPLNFSHPPNSLSSKMIRIFFEQEINKSYNESILVCIHTILCGKTSLILLKLNCLWADQHQHLSSFNGDFAPWTTTARAVKNRVTRHGHIRRVPGLGILLRWKSGLLRPQLRCGFFEAMEFSQALTSWRST